MSISGAGTLIASAVLETVDLPILALDADLRVEVVNDAFLRRFEVAREQALGRFVYDLGNGQWDLPELRRLLADVLERNALIKNYRVEHTFERIGRRVMRLNAKRIHRPEGGVFILLVISDDTERERLQLELAGRVEFSDKLIDSVREALLVLHRDLRVHSANQVFYDLFKVDRAATEGCLVYELGDRQWDIPQLRRLLEDILPNAKSFDDYEVRHTFEAIGPRVMLLNGRRLDHLDLILLAIRDVTEQRATEQARQERERRQAFLLALNDAIHPIADPVLVQAMASERLGRQLEAGQVAYAEIDEKGTWAIISHDWNDGTIPTNVGRRHLTDFAGAVIADLKRGQTIVIGDVARDPRTSARASVRTFESRSIAALINVPLVKEGRLDAVLAIHARAPRQWHPSQVLLAEEVAERMWSAVERARTEAALRESELRHRTLVRATSAVTWFCAPSGLQIEPQPEWMAFSGQSAEEMLGDGWTKAVHPDDIASAGSKWREAVARAEPYLSEHRVLRHDGQWRWMSVHAVPVRNGSGAVVRWYGMNIDITEQKQAEAARARLAAVVASSSEPIIAKALDGTVTSWNEAAERIFGYSAEEMIGTSIRRLVPPDRQTEEDDVLRRASRGERIESYETVRISKQGRPLDVAVTVSPIIDERGRIIGLSTIARDVSERKRAEERERLLMHEVTHRAKNMLAVVQSIAKLTAARSPGDFVERFTERLQALSASHDVLVESGWRHVPLDTLVRSQLAFFAGLIGNRIRLSGPRLEIGAAAAQAIGMALHELSTNAAKYGSLSNETGLVTISWRLLAEGREPRLVISWCETGGPPVSKPSRRGFGSVVTGDLLKRSVGGEVKTDFAADGLVWKLSCPAAKVIEREPG